MTSSAPDWATFYSQIHRFVAARVRGASDVDDLVQLILERAMAKSASSTIENSAGWLFGIARNAIADHYRQHARSLNAAADALDATPSPLGATDEERTAVIACMEPLLNTLAEQDAELLRWADMEGRSMQAIAEALGISLTATKSRVQRARKEFIKVTRACCVITMDARGRVTELAPRAAEPLACAAPCTSSSAKNERKSS